MRFFAGYPITPATEIAELSSELLPKYGGTYMQMEDELASIAAVIGASAAGVKAMTATSGPGVSLMQENLGYGIIAEIPLVIVDCMRQGPCQGVATQPAQGDIMQARWGTQGDHPIIALAPASVSELYTETIRAFNLSEKYRNPVYILSDAMLAHMSERVCVPEAGDYEIIDRKKPTCPPEEYLPYADSDGTGIPPMAAFGDGYHWNVTGMIHDDWGFPATDDPSRTAYLVKRIHDKIEHNLDDIVTYETYKTEDAQILIVSLGIVSRSAKEAIDELRNDGVKVGLFRPITVWPFPEAPLAALCSHVKQVITCEMNEGQLYHIVREVKGNTPIRKINQNNGLILSADTIVAAIKEEL
ncbi:MAG: 2-oxoacid:acceptor oxidoreductase subunit alpha [Megasphaera sp.]|nr:2-oxoacid:acceptor oxidoreductase subunit alpha [Megasphaera sp.]MCH4188565.1 2-oxoacid:acceptor oxidoreductase subunit alpha [Megasphaera sp.]MCH4218452.1 2-oxoacid:acceptor oxidoreductase subunit alpha [Megasphaera sp.]